MMHEIAGPSANTTLSPYDMIRISEIVRALPHHRLEAWLLCGRLLTGGMSAAEAEALMWQEIAR